MENKIREDKIPPGNTQTTAGNVKSVVFPGGKKVYVCPYPEPHFKYETNRAKEAYEK